MVRFLYDFSFSRFIMSVFEGFSNNLKEARVETKHYFLQVFVKEFIGSLDDMPSCFEETRYGRADIMEKGEIRKSFVDKIFVGFPLGDWSKILASDSDFRRNLSDLVLAMGEGVRYSVLDQRGDICSAVHEVLCGQVQESDLEKVYKRIRSLYE
jgi:hypothetical protein